MVWKTNSPEIPSAITWKFEPLPEAKPLFFLMMSHLSFSLDDATTYNRFFIQQFLDATSIFSLTASTETHTILKISNISSCLISPYFFLWFWKIEGLGTLSSISAARASRKHTRNIFDKAAACMWARLTNSSWWGQDSLDIDKATSWLKKDFLEFLCSILARPHLWIRKNTTHEWVNHLSEYHSKQAREGHRLQPLLNRLWFEIFSHNQNQPDRSHLRHIPGISAALTLMRAAPACTQPSPHQQRLV